MSTRGSPAVGLTWLHIDKSRPSPAEARVAVVGEVDLATAPALRDTLLRALQERDPAVLEVDLTGITFLDCTGVGALVAVRNTAVHNGCRLRVTNPQPIVRLVLKLTGLLDVLTAPVDWPPLTSFEYPSGTEPASEAAA